MSTRKTPPPLPTNAIQAVVLREDRHWYAVFGEQKLPITDQDAWNYDISGLLSVAIVLEEVPSSAQYEASKELIPAGTTIARIIRKRGNKRYVTI